MATDTPKPRLVRGFIVIDDKGRILGDFYPREAQARRALELLPGHIRMRREVAAGAMILVRWA